MCVCSVVSPLGDVDSRPSWNLAPSVAWHAFPFLLRLTSYRDKTGQHNVEMQLTRFSTTLVASSGLRRSCSSSPAYAARRFSTGSAAARSSAGGSGGSAAGSGSNSNKAPPHPPKGTASSTSALDFKLQHPRPRPPSLPEIDPPKWSAEYAVTNIL